LKTGWYHQFAFRGSGMQGKGWKART